MAGNYRYALRTKIELGIQMRKVEGKVALE